jgi:hypothetical protein
MWALGGRLIVIPRHRELSERLARRLLEDLEDVLGVRWWER